LILDRLYYELKIMGRWATLTPLLIVMGTIPLTFLLFALKTDPKRFLMAVPEMLLPLVGGVVVGAVITQDSALELHLTVPRKYHLTGMLRLALVLLSIGCIALLFINLLPVFNLLYVPPQEQILFSPFQLLVIRQGIWFAPLLWCIAVGFCFSLIMQGWTGNVALLGGIWVIEIVFKDLIALNDWLRPTLLFPTTLLFFGISDGTPSAVLSFFDTYWLTTRFELIGTAVVLLMLGWLLLRQTERMLKGTTVE